MSSRSRQQATLSVNLLEPADQGLVAALMPSASASTLLDWRVTVDRSSAVALVDPTLTLKDPASRATVNIWLSPVEDLCRGEAEVRLRRDFRVSDLVVALDSAAKQLLRSPVPGALSRASAFEACRFRVTRWVNLDRAQFDSVGFYKAQILMKLQPSSAEQLRSESKLTPQQLEGLLVHLQNCHVLDVMGPECTRSLAGESPSVRPFAVASHTTLEWLKRRFGSSGRHQFATFRSRDGNATARPD